MIHSSSRIRCFSLIAAVLLVLTGSAFADVSGTYMGTWDIARRAAGLADVHLTGTVRNESKGPGGETHASSQATFTSAMVNVSVQ